MKIFCKTFILFSTLSASLIALQTADARERIRRNETWCLETALDGGRGGGGGTINLCQFETRAQCIQSKVTQGDRCDINPVLAFEEWNRRHGR
jgi:hypothetical protein